MGGPAIRKPERLDREWAFGASAESAVRRSVQRHGVRGRGTALVIGCGALARELLAVAERIPGLDVACLAPDLHNRPDGIPAAVRQRIQRARAEGYEWIFIAYADCGTGGLLDPVLADEGVERLPGAHCYEVFAGGAEFERLADQEPGTFWLTDFLARNFERLVIRGLGIDRHPELQSVYFANYRRVVYLSQTDDPDLLAMARRAADRLGLAFEHRRTGLEGLRAPIAAFAAGLPGASGGAGAERAGPEPEGRQNATPDLSSRGTGGPDTRRAGRTLSDTETDNLALGTGRTDRTAVGNVAFARPAGTARSAAVDARGARPADSRVAR